VRSVAFSPDGKTVASGSEDKSIRPWEVASHRPVRSPLTSPRYGVTSVAFSPDGRTLAGGSLDRSVWLWNVARQRPVALFYNPTRSTRWRSVPTAKWLPAGATTWRGYGISP